MNCPDCGAPNPEGAQFCNECGKQLPEAGLGIQEEKPIKDERVITPASPSKGKGINLKIVLLIIVAVVVVGAAAAYFILPSYFASPQASTVAVIQAVSGTAVINTNGSNYTVNIDYYAIGRGSGFIVNNQGYIVTAAHVVSDPYDLRYKGTIRKLNESDIKWYVAQAAIYAYLKEKSPSTLSKLSQSDLDNLTNSAITSGSVKVTNSNYDIYIAGPSFPDSMTEKNYVAQMVDYSATDNQEKDLALLKVDNPPANLPALPISGQKPKTGDSVFIYGYPQEQSEFAQYITSTGNQKQFLESMANATLTKGIVSAERTSPKGTTYYQTDAAVDHGNSGGPVLNSNNQVIGVLVLGFGNTGSFNFFLSSQYVTDMLKKNGLA
jgi:S1-C subfamily serine protease